MSTKQQEQTPSVSPVLKIVGIIAAIIAVVGIGVLIMGKAQQSDPTLTKAPPPGPNAQTLVPSPMKAQHPGPMYRMTPNGPVPNQSGPSPTGAPP